jgi:hypothetical protein
MATKTAETRRSRSGGSRTGAARERRASRSDRPTAPRPEDRRFLERFGNKLSKSTQRAKWTGSPDDRPDRAGQTLATRSHEVIEAWAEARDARPATATRGPDGRPRTLRMDFGEPTRNLESIAWDEWFSVFDERDLVFLYQEKRRDGSQSNFFRLDNPRREEG